MRIGMFRSSDSCKNGAVTGVVLVFSASDRKLVSRGLLKALHLLVTERALAS
ncbi:MAG: hypothetical protein QW096_13045 [Thermofilaceae archaeon]